jgi:MoxR-like ATPase
MTQLDPIPDWFVFRGTGKADGDVTQVPAPPPWREFGAGSQQWKGSTFKARREAIEMVNAALYLRRPLLITGRPGMGKSSLAYAIAHELQLGSVLKWAIYADDVEGWAVWL